MRWLVAGSSAGHKCDLVFGWLGVVHHSLGLDVLQKRVGKTHTVDGGADNVLFVVPMFFGWHYSILCLILGRVLCLIGAKLMISQGRKTVEKEEERKKAAAQEHHEEEEHSHRKRGPGLTSSPASADILPARDIRSRSASAS